jgi:ABC-type molybdate transport system substrate-binding protein
MFQRILRFAMIIIIFGSVVMSAKTSLAGQRLMVFAGAASKPATEEAAKAFEKKTGIKVDLTFGGSGYVLSQMMFLSLGDKVTVKYAEMDGKNVAKSIIVKAAPAEKKTEKKEAAPKAEEKKPAEKK